jgi:membrane associated rhomboid family serine protease
MIPIRDDVPHSSTPWVNYFLIALNIMVFLAEASTPPAALQQMVFQFGVVPARTVHWLTGGRGVSPEAALFPLLASMFLHGGWLHVLGNMWFLWIFGDNVEDHLGHARYLTFYLLAGIIGSMVHIALNPSSDIPSVGASGAIAGVMGAYFVLYPSARVLTLVPFFFIYFVWLPAWVMLGYWFVVQFLSGAATSIAYAQQTNGGTAFWAHVGGFIAGALMIKVFPSRPPRYRYNYWQ